MPWRVPRRRRADEGLPAKPRRRSIPPFRRSVSGDLRRHATRAVADAQLGRPVVSTSPSRSAANDGSRPDWSPPVSASARRLTFREAANRDVRGKRTRIRPYVQQLRSREEPVQERSDSGNRRPEHELHHLPSRSSSLGDLLVGHPGPDRSRRSARRRRRPPRLEPVCIAACTYDGSMRRSPLASSWTPESPSRWTRSKPSSSRTDRGARRRSPAARGTGRVWPVGPPAAEPVGADHGAALVRERVERLEGVTRATRAAMQQPRGIRPSSLGSRRSPKSSASSLVVSVIGAPATSATRAAHLGGGLPRRAPRSRAAGSRRRSPPPASRGRREGPHGRSGREPA
jgi:hypothetical protein